MQKWMILSLVLAMSLTGASQAAQNTTDREAEATQAAAEDEAARKANSDAIYTDYNGILRLFTKEQQEDYDASVVGTLVVDKKSYLIKLESPKLLDDLKLFDGKDCVVSAKIRNAGKYLVVRKVVLNGAPYDFKRRRGGIGM